MKKFLFAMLVIIMALNRQVRAADNACGDYTYKVENGYAVITGYTGSGGNITIPGNLDGYIVKIIGEEAFLKNSTITSVKMANTITSIQREAFTICTKLEEIETSSSLSILGVGVFADCPLLKKILLPKSLESVSQQSFAGCPELMEITVRESNATDRSGFYSIEGILFCDDMIVCYPGKKSGDSYVIPDFVSKVYSCAFCDIGNLKTLIIPSSVEKIYLNAIARTQNSIDILLKHDAVPEIASQAFNTLAPGSRIICKNEALRAKAAASIKGNGVTAVLVSETGGKIPATGLQVTTSQITVEPGKTAQISWTQTPALTTDNVTWESSDETGLTVETYTGKITAIYRGTYTVTGKDESGHTVDVTVEVPFIKDNGEVFATDFTVDPNGEWENDWLATDVFYVGDMYGLRYMPKYSWLEQGIVYDDAFTFDWKISKTGKLWENTDWQYSNVDICFIPYEAGSYTISYICKDKSGIELQKGEKTIQVIRDTSKLVNLSQSKGTLKGISFLPTGQEIRPEIDTVVGKDGTLIAKDFYTVSYRENINPGTGYVVLTGRYIVTGKLEIPFTIQKPTPSVPAIATITGTASYTKTYGDKDFLLSLKTNSTQIMQFTSSNTKVAAVSQSGKISIKGAGKATITVQVPKSSTMTSAEKKVMVQVNKASLSKASIGKIVDQVYSGKEKKPSVKVVYQGITLKPGIDYRVTYQNNKKAGTATATIAGSGNYAGSRKASFRILTIAKPSSFCQDIGRRTTTSSIQLTWKKVSGASGYRIYRSTSKSGGFKEIETITRGSTTSYTDKKLRSGSAYYYKVRAYRRISGKNVDGANAGVLAASTKPGKASLSVKAGSKKAVLAWKPVKGASGYEIYRGTSKKGKFSKIKTLTKGSTRSYTNSKLNGNKTYYYKLRSYRIVDGKKLYSDYSTIRVVKVKK